MNPPLVMLALLAQKLPDGRGWVFEPKLDGFRGMLVKDGSTVTTSVVRQ
jgi:ATP-dependent DNA ligase